MRPHQQQAPGGCRSLCPRRLGRWLCAALLFVGAAGDAAPPRGASERARARLLQGEGAVRLLQVGAGVRVIYHGPGLSPGLGGRGGRGVIVADGKDGQTLDKDARIEAAGAGGAEVDLAQRAHLRLEPRGVLSMDVLPPRKGAGEVTLVDGVLHAEVSASAGGPLLIRTMASEVRLRGKARIESVGRDRVLLSIYEGSATARVGRAELVVPAGKGVVLRAPRGRGRPAAVPLRRLLPAPGWEGGDAGLLALGIGGLDDRDVTAAPALTFQRVAGAEQYRVEVVAAARPSEPHAGGDVVAPPLRPRLSAGAYRARVHALDDERLAGPPGPALSLWAVTVRSDAAQVLYPPASASAKAPPVLLHRGASGRLLLEAEGLELQARINGAPLRTVKAANEAQGELAFARGEHQIDLSVAGTGVHAALRVVVAPPARGKPAPLPAPVEATDVPAPLFSVGAPLQPLHPRTRVSALLSFGGARADERFARPDVYRLDLGSEIALLSRRLGVSVALPVIYQISGQLSGQSGGAALGDLVFGARGVALTALDGRLALGPQVRVVAATGTYERTATAQVYPAVLDVALGAALRLGRVGLLTTQGPSALLSPSAPRLLWSMGYGLQLTLSRLALAAEVNAALRLYGETQSAVSVAGSARLSLGSFRLLLGGRGGLGESGAAVYGRYLGTLGVEWLR